MKIKILTRILLATISVAMMILFLNAKAVPSHPGNRLQDDPEEYEKTLSCGGVERWSVKVFTDALASTIDWTPKSTSIAHLVAIVTPTPSASMPRYQPVEDSTYIVNCMITIKKDEADSDFHLVLSDGIHTLVGEVPNPNCTSVAASPKVAQFITARNWVVQNIGYGNKNVSIPPVSVTGVAFVDPPHGQTGGAPNNIELHSIIDIHYASQGSAPTATTQAATLVTSATATLNGVVNPNSVTTSYHFEWGLTTSYGNSTTVISAGSGSANINASTGISSLAAGTTYHFRLVAANSNGTTNGSDLTFTALSPTLSVTPSNLNVTAASGTVSYSVTSNSSWTAVSNQTWCTVTPSGTGNGTITATFAVNSLVVQRVANITVTVSGLAPAVVTVTQAGIVLPPEPSNNATGFSGCNIRVHWTDATGSVVPTAYLIRMSQIGFTSIATPVDGIAVPDSPTDKNVPAGAQEAWFKNLLPHTTYYFKIFGYTGSGSTIYYKTDGQVPDVEETTQLCNN
jgi:Viral BACON domain